MANVSHPERIPAGLAPVNPRPGAIEVLRRNWGWFLAFGIAMIVVGTLAIGASFVATLATVIAFGMLLLFGAAVQVVGALFSRKWSGFFLQLLAGLLYLVVGALMLSHPVRAAAGLTLMIAAILLVGGMFRIIVSMTERFESWGWVFLNGAITVLLGVLIWRQWPWSGLWVIGLFVGIELIFCGWSWVMLALSARRIAPRET